MDQGQRHPFQAKPTGDQVSREKSPWAGHVVCAVAPLTILGVALLPLLMGFACKDGGKAGAGCRGGGARAGGQLGTGTYFQEAAFSYSDFLTV